MRKRRSRLSSRRALYIWILACCTALSRPFLLAQTASLSPTTPPRASAETLDSPTSSGSSELPESPSPAPGQEEVVVAARLGFESTGDPTPSPTLNRQAPWQSAPPRNNLYGTIQQRRSIILADQRFLNDQFSLPMTPRQKAFLAATDFSDPGNLAVIGASSAVYTATNAHSAYGPGLMGFGRNYGYSLSQAATGELFGTWLIPTLAHQDPRYHRMPGAPLQRRILHALAHTIVAQSDSGAPLPNYATLLTYPIAAEIADLYVPGLHTSGSATAKRILIGLASDPSDALIGEFLPDVARRVHIRVTFFQQIINDISTDHPM